MSHRAKVGGDYGANGEWYKGGQFVNTIAENDKRSGKKTKSKGSRKVEIEPYKWVPSRDGMFPVFSIVGTVAEWIDRQNPDAGIRPYPPGVQYYGDTCKGHAVADLCEAYNAGERWADDNS